MAPTLYPAVDILGGRAVRLEQGDFARSRRYSDDPVEAARRWADEGARRLHVVDLDGARNGRPVNIHLLRAIAGDLRGSVDLIQYGGGLRTIEAAQEALEGGADRIVIGTAAFRDRSLLERLLEAYPDRLAVGVDVREQRVAVHGWQERTAMEPEDAVRGLVGLGARTVVYTNVDRDGTLEGIDARAVAAVAEAAGDSRVICSGGIGDVDDLRALASLGLPNLDGVIVGKALYEGRFTIAEALDALESGRE